MLFICIWYLIVGFLVVFGACLFTLVLLFGCGFVDGCLDIGNSVGLLDCFIVLVLLICYCLIIVWLLGQFECFTVDCVDAMVVCLASLFWTFVLFVVLLFYCFAELLFEFAVGGDIVIY